jgi:O-antigen ligase
MNRLFIIARVTLFSTFIMLTGLLIGAMIIVLPPLIPISLVAMAGIMLIWAMPELRWVPNRSLRKIFFAAVFVELAIPNYYAIVLSGLPWISLRRLFVSTLIVLFLIAIAGSAPARSKIVKTLSANKLLSFCVIGYLVMAVISFPTSASVAVSSSILLEAILNWYLPFFACLLVITSERDVLILYKLIAWCSAIVGVLGIAEFFTQTRWLLKLIPPGILAELADSNPTFGALVYGVGFRNGLYRSISIFTDPLSFGEFAAMSGPLGSYFLIHGRTKGERILGLAVVVSSMMSLFATGSRGGMIGFALAMSVLAALSIIRYSRANPGSLIGLISAVLATTVITGVVGLVFLSQRLYNIIIGSGEAASSNDARAEQWHMAWPHIFDNPITGHGIGTGAKVVGFTVQSGFATIDSYALSLLVETGFPGLIFFFGSIACAIWSCARIYLTRTEARFDIGGPLACSLIPFFLYRLTLSQRENHAFFFLLLAIALVFISLANRQSSTVVDRRQKLTTGDTDQNIPEAA